MAMISCTISSTMLGTRYVIFKTFDRLAEIEKDAKRTHALASQGLGDGQTGPNEVVSVCVFYCANNYKITCESNNDYNTISKRSYQIVQD